MPVGCNGREACFVGARRGLFLDCFEDIVDLDFSSRLG